MSTSKLKEFRFTASLFSIEFKKNQLCKTELIQIKKQYKQSIIQNYNPHPLLVIATLLVHPKSLQIVEV